MMNGRKFNAAASLIFVLIFITGVALRAQDNKTPYPNMTPLDQYLMDRDAEIALARSAAPDAISRDAKVLVLGRMATKPFTASSRRSGINRRTGNGR
jgi:hypothetical protein